MVTPRHEALHQIARDNPETVERALERVHGLRLPPVKDAEILNVDLTTIEAVERRVDSLVRLRTDGRDIAMIFEAQLDNKEIKQSRWPYYVAFVHDKYDCDVLLIVITHDAADARRFEEPIIVGLEDWTTLTVRAVVFGPHNVPRITTLDEAREDAVFAILSALVHSHAPDPDAILEPLALVLGEARDSTQRDLYEFVEAGLVGETQELWRHFVKTYNPRYVSTLRQEGIAEGRAEGIAEGRAEGKVKAVLLVLQGRGIALSEKSRARVLGCTDPAVLDDWLLRAATAVSEEDVFG
ncbi:hypothetical protein [Actinomadura rupiterrae]|uniref:hypothetical protein n=1 Tax=Actinomadura rupiterrae TaxID=559627 RepID=UPI0020A2D101|nr:hypothetical protein [Actinomadura rupiterrae]MCP2337090.1 hypothetical protein [Actinomadura rupiterrae]